MTALRDTKIRELWEQGLSGRKIAKRLAVPQRTVVNAVQVLEAEVSGKDQMANSAHPQETSPRSMRTPLPLPLPETLCLMKAERDTKIRELWEQGLSVRKIAESLGVGKTVVHAVVVALKEEVSGKDQMANSGHPPRNLPDQ